MAESPANPNDVHDMVDKAVAEAKASIDDLKKVAEEAATPAQGDADLTDAKPVEVPDLGELAEALEVSKQRDMASGIELLKDVDLHVTIELGRTRMLVEDVLSLSGGAVVELDKPAGDPVDVYVNGRLVARGEVLVLNDNFCIRISEIVADLEEQAEAAAEEQVEAKAG